MAKQVDFTTASEIHLPSSYWRVDRVMIDFASKTAVITINAYASATAAGDKAEPVLRKDINIGGSLFDSLFDKPSTNKILGTVYTQLNTLDSQFAGSSDV